MKRYKVIALYVQGRRKRPFEAGDEVTEANFYEGVAEILAKAKFLERIGEDDKKEVVLPQPWPDITEVLKVAEDQPEKNNIGPDLNFNRITRKEMIIDLQKAGIQFDDDESKRVLYEKWKELR